MDAARSLRGAAARAREHSARPGPAIFIFLQTAACSAAAA